MKKLTIDFILFRDLLRIGTIVLVIFNLGCASVYKGPNPNFNPTSKEEAQREYDKFKFEHHGFLDSHDYFEMNGTKYTASSLEPLMETVSPEGTQLLSTPRKLHLASTIVTYTALAALIGAFIVDSHSNVTWYIVGADLGTVMTLSIVASSKMSAAADQYNLDLHKKLFSKYSAMNPTLNFAFHY